MRRATRSGDASARYRVSFRNHGYGRDQPKQEQLLDAINQRLDQLDTAATPAVAGILTASARLPAADRIYVHKRLMRLGHPNTEWATSLR